MSRRATAWATREVQALTHALVLTLGAVVVRSPRAPLHGPADEQGSHSARTIRLHVHASGHASDADSRPPQTRPGRVRADHDAVRANSDHSTALAHGFCSRNITDPSATQWTFGPCNRTAKRRLR